MVAGFDGIDTGPAIEFTLDGDGDTAAHLRFEPEALQRLVEVARRMLAIPIDPGSRGGPPVTVESLHGFEVREIREPDPLDTPPVPGTETSGGTSR